MNRHKYPHGSEKYGHPIVKEMKGKEVYVEDAKGKVTREGEVERRIPEEQEEVHHHHHHHKKDMFDQADRIIEMVNDVVSKKKKNNKSDEDLSEPVKKYGDLEDEDHKKIEEIFKKHKIDFKKNKVR